MGEYARRKTDGRDVKIGTCESLYYLRWEDRHAVEHIPGNINAGRDYDLRWRLPFPDEDTVALGAYDEYSRGVRLYRMVDAGGGRESLEDFQLPEAINNPGTMQLRHEASGLLVNINCYHGMKLPEVGPDAKSFWNGKGHSFELCFVKNTKSGVLPIVRCRHCSEMWSVDSWDDVLPFIPDLTLRNRLAVHAQVVAEVA